jgi:hypothetical protein
MRMLVKRCGMGINKFRFVTTSLHKRWFWRGGECDEFDVVGENGRSSIERNRGSSWGKSHWPRASYRTKSKKGNKKNCCSQKSAKKNKDDVGNGVHVGLEEGLLRMKSFQFPTGSPVMLAIASSSNS